MAKREPDKLALEMIQCKKDGFGCHYGAWKAAQERPVVIEKKENEIPEGWKVCPHCGTPYKPNKWGCGRQIYCDVTCQKAAQSIRRSAQNAERQKRYRERKKAQAEIADMQEKERTKNEKFKAEQAELAEIMKVWKENRKKVQYESCSG